MRLKKIIQFVNQGDEMDGKIFIYTIIYILKRGCIGSGKVGAKKAWGGNILPPPPKKKKEWEFFRWANREVGIFDFDNGGSIPSGIFSTQES